MNIINHIKNGQLLVRVIPHSSQLRLIEENGQLRLYLTAAAEDNKANLQLIKFFKKEQGLKVKIVSGLRNRNKIVEVLE